MIDVKHYSHNHMEVASEGDGGEARILYYRPKHPFPKITAEGIRQFGLDVHNFQRLSCGLRRLTMDEWRDAQGR